jgi:hypothetical protein
MLAGLFSPRRSEPDHLLPAAGGTVVLALLLPVVALVGWSIAGWALAALLWLGLHVLDLFVVRARSKPGGSPASSGIQAFALLFKLLALLVVLFAALAANRDLALTTALTYGLAYTFELGLSLASYFRAQSA